MSDKKNEKIEAEKHRSEKIEEVDRLHWTGMIKTGPFI